MSSSGRSAAVGAGDLQVVPASGRQVAALPPRPPASSSTALVEYTPPAVNPEDEDLEIKLRRILECVPVRVSNTSGSSAGSGSGDFHQDQICPHELTFSAKTMDGESAKRYGIASELLKYRQMRRREQDRLARMDADYQRRKEIAEFNLRREEKLKTAEERTAKKRARRQKKKQRKKEKKSTSGAGGEENRREDSSGDDEADSDNN
ncbi:hypothetical protein RND71_000328 [Anisodus tanguticus]|uniref:PRKR-interacting protein 1 n=1 Tax=Anisodus tanguticus TaxID=243964 RepID=A0AAE1SZ84_9SOLA|nr:hypothetical protein RND71_000328 [Anisodus tanguticus]